MPPSPRRWPRLLLRALIPATVWLAARVPNATAVDIMDRVRSDLAAGQDVVVTSYVGFWYEHRGEPQLNLYWGALYGHDAMFDRAAEIEHRLPFLRITRYTTLVESGSESDPIATKVIAAPSAVAPEGGRSAPGRIVVVYLGYRNLETAVVDMAIQLKTGRIPAALAGREEVAALLRRSYVVGYWGHNVHYGGREVDALRAIASTREDPRGVFVVGCQTARWCPGRFLGGSIQPFLFATTNMAPEAYVALALYDGLGRGLARSAIRDHVARAYQEYQRLPNPPGGLFRLGGDRDSCTGRLRRLVVEESEGSRTRVA